MTANTVGVILNSTIRALRIVVVNFTCPSPKDNYISTRATCTMRKENKCNVDLSKYVGNDWTKIKYINIITKNVRKQTTIKSDKVEVNLKDSYYMIVSTYYDYSDGNQNWCRYGTSTQTIENLIL